MTQLHDLRLRLLVQQESERIAESQPTDLDLSVVQARCLCWLALLAEAHEDQASDDWKGSSHKKALMNSTRAFIWHGCDFCSAAIRQVRRLMKQTIEP